MEKTMYMVEYFNRKIPTIKPVVIDYESEDYVRIKGNSNRHLRRTVYTSFFKTHEMAFDFINDKLGLDAKRANERYANFLEVTPKTELLTA